MFFHPSVMLFVFFLLFSLIMMISMSSWFMIWFFIEMNLLSFIPLILLKKNKYSVESSLKYFFIQTISSIMILMGMILLFMNIKFYNLLFISSLSIKLGLAPFHQWIVNIVEGFSWPLMWVFLTVQKIGPFVLFSYIYNMEKSVIWVIYFISLLCAFFGCLGGLYMSSLRKIMVFSSISHNSWLILGMMLSTYLWFIYFIFYSIILLSVLYIFMSYYIGSLNQMFLKLNFFTSMVLGVGVLSLGGLPPLSGFVPKFIYMKEFLLFYNYFILLFLLLSVFISLFFYCRLFIYNFIYMSNKNFFLSSKNMTINIIMYINIMGFIFLPWVMFIY
uniref:NADH-ubiquinone oxidoreductase chain 2 n=1 Tax=Metacrangonyx panousei TaxID=1199244 RepID=K7ZVT2_9CRUS|nr:NADH dehydrogenase subunit 2 [Metacrangonyx panousei]CCI69459.1 NADH dehydrogenase subunit 2 [Metacrangonyx panousei]